MSDEHEKDAFDSWIEPFIGWGSELEEGEEEEKQTQQHDLFE
jgi:hypothetical protein